MTRLERYQVLQVDSQTIKARDIAVNINQVDFADDENMTGSFLQTTGRPLGRFTEIGFITELKGLHPTQTLGTANVFSKLFKATGLTESLTPGASAAYATNNTPNTGKVAITALNVYRGAAQNTTGIKEQMANVVFNATLRIVANRIAEIEWNGRGNFVHNPIEASMPTVSETAGNPLRALRATATFNSTTLSLREFEFNFGNEIILPENVVQKYGYDSAEIVNRSGANVMMLFKEPAVATFNPWELMQLSGEPNQDQTSIAVSIALGNYAKNRCAISCTFNISAAPERVVQDGIYYYRIQGKPTLDAFAMTFT